MSEEATNSHIVGDQEAVFAFLADPASHGLSEPVKRIDTHGAVVFLAGEHAYKVKRAVLYPFMDFSTLDKRHAACVNEVALNKAYAPNLYLNVRAISLKDGKLSFDDEGEVVEWAVRMKRFDETATLDQVSAKKRLSPDLLRELAAEIAEAHQKATPHTAVDFYQAITGLIQENVQTLFQYTDLFPPEVLARFTELNASALEVCEEVLRDRSEAGFVRHCHGDLHLRNIALIDGHPVLFDALEFDATLATTDILYDLAFLLMDLAERQYRFPANYVLNRYLVETGLETHLEGLAALPLMISVRAAIRAKVTAANAALVEGEQRSALEKEALAYFEFSSRALKPVAPTLIAVGGYSGSGKTSLASRLAGEVGPVQGAIHLRSDVERKRMSGVAESERLPAAHYTQEASDAVYQRLRDLSARLLKAGQNVVVDAVHLKEEERKQIAAVAEAAGARFVGLWLDTPEAIANARVEARDGDASDADVSVVKAQVAHGPGALGWHRLDGSGGIGQALVQAMVHCRSYNST